MKHLIKLETGKRNKMDDSLLKLEVDNLRELLRLKDLNNDLYEMNTALLSKLVKLLERYHDNLDPETIALLGRANQILRDIHTEPVNRIFTGEGTNRRLDRTLKQYSYKVLVPYYTVW